MKCQRSCLLPTEVTEPELSHFIDISSNIGWRIPIGSIDKHTIARASISVRVCARVCFACTSEMKEKVTNKKIITQHSVR